MSEVNESPWATPFDAVLVLEDGRAFPGRAFGARVQSVGEIVFNTSMTGYQEILTDPSYAGQLVTMTSSHIGNYGVNTADMESRQIWSRGMIVRSISEQPSSWRASMSLPEWFEEQGIVGISEVDTRALTRHIRDKGVMKAIIAPGKGVEDAEELRALLDNAPDYGEEDFVSRAMVKEELPASARQSDELYGEHLVFEASEQGDDGSQDEDAPDVVVLDFGAKHSILRLLSARGCRVTVLPGFSTPDEIRAHEPDGVLLSNGPGDPAVLDELVANLTQIIGEQPTFGICLGHQVLARVTGATTYKLPFGHRGPNQPVKNLSSGKVAMTSQNHGYAVDAESMPDTLEVTHINLNDDTVAGFRHRELPVVAVQYHPEAGPGPHDAEDFFDEFVAAIATHRNARRS